MCPGYIVPARPTVLEGDYSDWTVYDSFDDTDMYVGDWENHAFFNKAETEVLFVDENVCKKYDIASKSLAASSFNPDVISGAAMAQGGAVRSAFGTYVVWIDEAKQNVYVMKNGAVKKTLNYTDLGINSGYINSVAISPKGKYIAVAGKRTATGNYGWVILEGS